MPLFAALRANAATRIIVIGFTKITRAFARWVGTELIAVATHDAAPQVILVDNILDRRSQIASEFRDVGRDVHESATPPEANAHLSLPGLIGRPPHHEPHELTSHRAAHIDGW